MLSILFVGSLPEDAPNYSDFLQFCKNLGHGVSEKHRILICGTTPRTADHSIAQGVFDRFATPGEHKGCPRITLYHTDEDESQTTENNALFDWFCDQTNPISLVKPFEVETKAFRQAIADCDVVTLIGGGNTSAELVDLAIEHQKPVLGFTSFGGTGKLANGELKRVYQLLGISDTDALILKARKMEASQCASYMDLVNRIHRTNPWSSKNSLRRGAFLIGALVFLLATAVACALFPITGGFAGTISEPLRLFLACISSGLLGSYVVFLRQLQTPSDVLLTRALPATGQGVAIGFAIAAFTQVIVSHVLSQDAIANDLSFVKLIGISSLVAFAVAWLGLRGLKKLDDIMGGIPSMG